MWERGEKLPSQRPNTMICCLCGRTFDSHRLETLIHVPRITAANDPMKFGADPPFADPGATALVWVHQYVQERIDLTHSYECSIVNRRKPFIRFSIPSFTHVRAYSRSAWGPPGLFVFNPDAKAPIRASVSSGGTSEKPSNGPGPQAAAHTAIPKFEI
jgi:hypothetical protein